MTHPPAPWGGIAPHNGALTLQQFQFSLKKNFSCAFGARYFLCFLGPATVPHPELLGLGGGGDFKGDQWSVLID